MLGIIGLIADMTIPTLHQSINEKVTVSSLKNFYSSISQAYSMSVQENGTPDEWDLGTPATGESAAKILSYISPYLKVIKDCKQESGCFAVENYKKLSGDDYGSFNDSKYAKVLLANGTAFYMTVYSDTCSGDYGDSPTLKNICGEATVDINGAKKPNQIGVDLFKFMITKKGVVPRGLAGQTFASFDSSCKDKSTATGWGCTAWVIYNENMDYLHCSDLSWDGSHYCK